jgi:pimeloyl-ACP methyl ester carboxylesterase
MQGLIQTFQSLVRYGLYTVGSVISLVVLGLYMKQDSLLYYPAIGDMPLKPDHNPSGYRSPGDHDVPFENCYITASDGVKIHAWLLLHGDSLSQGRQTIVYFHGNAGNIGYRLPNAVHMFKMGYNVLQVEYRGYGNSDAATVNEAGLKLDSLAAVNFLRNHGQVDEGKLVLFGRSLGGAVAFYLADEMRKQGISLQGVIVENTFLSISSMVDTLMPLVAPLKGLVLRIGWDNEKIVGGLECPVLYMAGKRDELVPHNHMLRLFELSEKKGVGGRLHVVENGTHNDTWVRGGAKYWQAFGDFMRDIGGRVGNVGNVGAEKKETIAVGVPVDGGGDVGEAEAIPIMKSFFFDKTKQA